MVKYFSFGRILYFGKVNILIFYCNLFKDKMFILFLVSPKETMSN